MLVILQISTVISSFSLLFTQICQFQIEENTRILEKLGQRYGSPAVATRTPGAAGYSTGDSEDDRSVTPGGSSAVPARSGRASVQEKWKMGARKALLHWCQSQITSKFGVQVRDFGKSWRDGNAFLAIVNSIKPGEIGSKDGPTFSMEFKFVIF